MNVFKLRTAALIATSVIIVLRASATETVSTVKEVEFNDQFLFANSEGKKININRFSKGNPVLAGVYNVTLYVNKKAEYSGNVEFKDNGTDIAEPCITSALMQHMELNTEELDNRPSDPETCNDLTALFPGTQINFDSAEQRLDISVPQIYVVSRPRGYVDPSLWDSGINAAMLSYDLNAYSSTNRDDTSQTLHAGLNYGVNLGAWRLRSRGSANWTADDGADYESQDLYVQRDIPALKSQMVMGDTYTSGETFDSISLRGVRLYSDDRMKPGASSGYVPVVRGVAKSNAKVTIRQNDNVIYQNTVPQGAFAISDYNPTGSGTDLDVTVEEADGSKSYFSVPFSSVTQLLSPGDSRWDIGLGELADDTSIERTRVATSTGYYGLSNLLTVYAGFEYTDTDYAAGLLGVAVNTPAGALAVDVTQSRTDVDGTGTQEGQSYRVTFSKLLEATDTSLNVAGYRFTTKNYYSLQDAASLASELKHERQSNDPDPWKNLNREKNEIQVNINQPLHDGEQNYGSVYLTGSWQDYWDNAKTTSQYSLGYSNSFRWLNYNISIQRAYNEYGEEDDRAFVSVSIPLNNLLGHSESPGGFNTLNSSASTDFKGNSQTDMSVGGNTADNLYSYSMNISSSQSTGGSLNQIGGYGSYNSPYGPVSVSLSANDDSGQQYSFGNSGGVVLHEGGITLTPGNLGANSTIALIQAKGAKGARLNNGDGVIDGSGYAVMPSLSPYRENTVGLNIDTLETDVEMENTSTTVIPRDGAVMKVNFTTNAGRSMVLELQRTDKGFIPLGADVYDSKNRAIGSVGQAGRAYIRGGDDAGELYVRWGSTPEEQCHVSYRIPEDPQKVGLTILLPGLQCQPAQ